MSPWTVPCAWCEVFVLGHTVEIRGEEALEDTKNLEGNGMINDDRAWKRLEIWD